MFQYRSALVCELLSNSLSVSCKQINHSRFTLVIWSCLQLTTKQWIITQQFTARADIFLKQTAVSNGKLDFDITKSLYSCKLYKNLLVMPQPCAGDQRCYAVWFSVLSNIYMQRSLFHQCDQNSRKDLRNYNVTDAKWCSETTWVNSKMKIRGLFRQKFL